MGSKTVLAIMGLGFRVSGLGFRAILAGTEFIGVLRGQIFLGPCKDGDRFWGLKET